MLLQELTPENNIFIAYYDSSNILMSKYVYSDRKLAIIFSKGQQYVYENVLPYHYQKFKIAVSQGKALKEHIIKNYTTQKANFILSTDDLQIIKDKILEMKQYL